MTRHIALFGATGTAGRATALALQNAGHRVTALGRRDPALPGITFQPADLSTNLATQLAPLQPDAILSCLASRTGAPADAWAVDHDANMALLHAAKTIGTPQFLLLSAICVQKPRLAFQHAKLAFEGELQASGLTYTIIRPTAFFKSLSGQFDRLKAGKPYLMFGDGRLTACTPISDADLGRFIAQSLTNPAAENAILPIGGPGPALTPHQMGMALFDALNLPPKFKSVPPGLLSTMATLMGIPGRVIPPLAAKAELARIGHYYATESMLLWDAQAQRYDAEATPAFGTDTLTDFYRALAAGTATVERGDHAVF